MKNSIKLLSLFLILICCLQLQAQTGVVRGEVFDENGLLPGVNISVSNVTTIINTDSDGAFAIKLKPGTYDFSFYFPDYTSTIKKVTVTDNKIKNLDVELFANDSREEESELMQLIKQHQGMLTFVKEYILRIK